MLVIDKDMLTSVIYNVEDNADIIFDISDKVVKDYLEDLDNLMNDIKENVVDIDDPATNIIEKSYIRLANMLYYVSAKVEDIGFYDDIATSAAKETYNRAYIQNQNKSLSDKEKRPTVAENQSIADEASKYENVTSNLYNRIYKIAKIKIEAAENMLKTLSKVLSKRMNEAYLLGTIDTGKRILNEDI